MGYEGVALLCFSADFLLSFLPVSLPPPAKEPVSHRWESFRCHVYKPHSVFHYWSESVFCHSPSHPHH